MRKSALIAAGALALATAPALAESRTYDFDNFHGVDISTGLNAVITKGSAFSVRAETGTGNLDRLDIKVRGGELHAGQHTDLFDIILSGGLLNMLDHKHDITLYITMPELDGIDASSGANVKSDFISGKHAIVDVSSGADVAIDNADVTDLSVKASSGASVRMAGTCTAIDMDFSSGAHIRADGLECIEVTVDGSSGASAEVAASGEVTGSMSSGASVRLYGDPDKINVESSSGGSVRAH